MSDLRQWRRSFRHHDELTLRVPRTMREAAADPSDWWEGPQEGVRNTQRPSRFDRLAWAVAVALLLVLAWAAMRVPG